MATIRVSGTRTTTPNSKAPTVIASPGNSIKLDSPSTVITGDLTVVGSANTIIIRANTNNVINPAGYQFDSANINGTLAQRLPGAVYVAGGVGIAKDLNVGGFIYGRISEATTSSNLITAAASASGVYYPLLATAPEGGAIYTNPSGESGSLTYDVISSVLSVGKVNITSSGTNALSVAGGGSIAGALSVTKTLNVLDITESITTGTGAVVIAGGVGIAGSLNVGGAIVIDSVAASVSKDTGALIVKGGLGVSGNLYVGDLNPNSPGTQTIGTSQSHWAEGYVDTLYSNIISSTAGNIQLNPAAGLTEIMGDLRVLGNKPVGTAPVVTNVLYVTMDGNDTNDGRAHDSSRACKTINGAISSPYFQPGTQIRVSPGRYLEDNPLALKPYTSVVGSDLRTTFIEPINKTQDLFHLDSGCYLAFMAFLNGRSGLLAGPYEPKFNRGAYATAFPPLTGDDRIDLFHSPYIQNCTNQSGPWLKDGTLFVPNQTVQVPKAVAMGTWAANTTTITVSASTGTIVNGMSINVGQQNSGFFDARTLMLANKSFMQEQVVSYVTQAFSNTALTYDKTKCLRDTGLALNTIALDLMYNSTSESVFAGRQYWSQDGTMTSVPSNEINQTKQAITILRNGTVAAMTANDVMNDVAYINAVTSNYNTISSILNYGNNASANAIAISNLIAANPNGAASTVIELVAAYNALLAEKTQIVNNTIASLVLLYPSLLGDVNDASIARRTTCRRDVGYIFDSVAFDLLHGGKKQSIKSAVYYYGYNNITTKIIDQIPETTAAYSFMKRLVAKVVKNISPTRLYQDTVDQVIGTLPSATDAEVNALNSRVDIITNIIVGGIAVAPPQTPIQMTPSSNVNVANAYAIIIANIPFIQAEVIGYIDNEFINFEYSTEKCRRDVGILVENISYDAAFGGNEKAVESGLAYYNGVVNLIAGQENQTTAAIDYLNNLANAIIVNASCVNLKPSSTILQVKNTVLTGGAISRSSITELFGTVTTIINNGSESAPAVYRGAGPDAAFVSSEILLQANRAFIQEDTINFINKYLIAPIPPLVQMPSTYLPYSKVKCARDTGLIIDSIAADLLFPTAKNTQSTFAGLQYWGQGTYVGAIASELTTTTNAVNYLRDTAVKIINKIQPANDLVARYQTSVAQNISLEAATAAETKIIKAGFNTITQIINGDTKTWSDRLVANGLASNLPSVNNAYKLLQANKAYLIAEVSAYVSTLLPTSSTSPGYLTPEQMTKCRADVGTMVDAISFDLLHGGNRQAVQSGLCYYGFKTTVSNIQGEQTQTVDAFNHMASIITDIVQNIIVNTSKSLKIAQNTSLPAASALSATKLAAAITTINGIIINGPTSVLPASLTDTLLIGLSMSSDADVMRAYKNLYANKDFIVAEIIAYLDDKYNTGVFDYDQAKCYRDVGLIIDAVSQDILLGGNQKSVEAGVSYWNSGYNYVSGQVSTTTNAINYARDLSLQVIANTPIVPQENTVLKQIINTFFQYGGDYMPQEAINRNFSIITGIIQNGAESAPPSYAGGGAFALTGLNGSDLKLPSKVTSVIATVTPNEYIIGLSQPTIGFGTKSTLYFGDTAVYPAQDAAVPSEWDQRKVDPIGGMGGSLVDGAVISETSPIQSFVYDAYTQLTQGGVGVHITNNGYAQLVSVFTIFCSVAVQVDNGGIASITNSNCNFGDISLLAKGYGTRKFSGTVYNPAFKAYGTPLLDEYYPSGYWPNNGQVEIYLPEMIDRPHISLVMEVEPEENTVNDQGFSGFLNAAPSLTALTSGSIVISGIDTEGIYIGNTVYIRDQNNNQTNSADSGKWYAQPGTIVTDVGYQSVTLNQALTSGAVDTLFNLYFCGNSYYTVLSSEIATNPKVVDKNILSVQEGLASSQVATHAASIAHLRDLVLSVINNSLVVDTFQSNTSQVVNPTVTGGSGTQSTPFVNQRFDNIIDILLASTISAAEAVVPANLKTKAGTIPAGAGSAISLITDNIKFLADEMGAWVADNIESNSNNAASIWFASTPVDAIATKCRRDVKVILRRLIYDLESGSGYNCYLSGISYWSRTGTHHLVTLGERVRRSDLFPDGATVNFYQRSYISASGYLFEYVGAGTNYGSLPQVGRSDPVQGKETVQLNSGKVFFTSTDQNGDFRIGTGLVISQATGVLSGRTFTKSLFANMTPFILAIESGGS